MKKSITIGYLYPEYMNIYGDTGNIITLKYRAEKRNIDIKIKQISLDDTLGKNEIDIYFFGGGQDEQQVLVSQNIQRLSQVINEDIEQGAVALTVCGGYQLFGKFYRPFSQNDLQGISVFPLETYASNTRMIGNSIVEIHPELYTKIQEIYQQKIVIPGTLVGFENHSGQTKIAKDSPSPGEPLGKVLHGFGNDETKTDEGFWKGNAFGTYLHGSLLPKNPHFADYLIYKALEYRYKDHVQLENLDDAVEYSAHNAILKKYYQKSL